MELLDVGKIQIPLKNSWVIIVGDSHKMRKNHITRELTLVKYDI